MRSDFANKILTVLLLATACGGRERTGTDGNTHWLECENDSDCTNYRCIDGYCRLPSETSYTPSEPSSDPALPADTVDSVVADDQDSTPNSEIGLNYASDVPGAIGAACIPSDEYSADFSGFNKKSVSLSPSEQCETNVCLVNKFQGRVTCPYGQGEQFSGECFTADGASRVALAVEPQLVERRPQDSVYCSCRCDGPDPTADYCACGEGFECEELVPASISGQEERVGSYCVAAGTEPNGDDISLNRCDEREPDTCGDPSAYTPDVLGVEPAVPTQSETVQVLFEQILWNDAIDNPDAYACLLPALPVTPNEQGASQAACRMFEAFEADSEGCERPGRTSVSEQDESFVRERMASGKLCADCSQFTVCELEQLIDSTQPDAASSCLNDEDANGDGWCYVAPSQAMGNEALVSQCPEMYPRRLRGIGSVLTFDSYKFLYCVGSP